jgi:hypothetical protein
MEKVPVMFPTIPQNSELLKHLEALLEAHRPIFKQERIFQRMKALVFGEIMAFGRHTLSQIILSLGLVNEDWTAWYRLFSRGRFQEAKANEVLLQECLQELGAEDLLVLGGDGTQTPRTSQKIEGTGFSDTALQSGYPSGTALVSWGILFARGSRLQSCFAAALHPSFYQKVLAQSH